MKKTNKKIGILGSASKEVIRPSMRIAASDILSEFKPRERANDDEEFILESVALRYGSDEANNCVVGVDVKTVEDWIDEGFRPIEKENPICSIHNRIDDGYASLIYYHKRQVTEELF